MKTFLMVFLFCSFVFGQVSLKETEVIQLQAEKTAIESKLLSISQAPNQYAQDKIKRLDEVIPKLPDRKAKEGRITMKQHLQNIKAEIEKNPAEYVVKETTTLINRKAQIETQITTLSKEVTDEKPIGEK